MNVIWPTDGVVMLLIEHVSFFCSMRISCWKLEDVESGEMSHSCGDRVDSGLPLPVNGRPTQRKI